MFKFCISRLVLLVVSLGISLYSVCAWAESELIHINDIRVKGLYRVTKGAVLLALPISVGDDVTKDDIQQGLKKVFETKNFDDISAKIVDDGVLVINVKERPTLMP